MKCQARNIIAFAAIAAATAGFAADGPFGLSAGMTQEQIVAAVKKGAVYSIEGPEIILVEPPQPHPQFASYHLTVSPKSGLVRVTAITSAIHESSYATETRSRYDALKKTLTEKYGMPTEDLDLVMPDSIWKDGRYYLESITHGDRLVMAAWSVRERGISSVILRTTTMNRTDGAIILDYQMDGYAEYDEAKREVNNGAL